MCTFYNTLAESTIDFLGCGDRLLKDERVSVRAATLDAFRLSPDATDIPRLVEVLHGLERSVRLAELDDSRRQHRTHPGKLFEFGRR